MRLLKITSQNRRDVWYDAECEACNEKEIHISGYDDRNYWDNVLPNKKCRKCKKSTNDMNLKIKQNIATKYPEGYQI